MAVAIAASAYALTYRYDNDGVPVAAREAKEAIPADVPSAAGGAAQQVENGSLASTLGTEITAALQATEWPLLDPPLEAVIKGPAAADAVLPCENDSPVVDLSKCTYGETSAPLRIVLAGDSEGITYAGPLRELAVNSGGQVQIVNMAMSSCAFTAELIDRAVLSPNCEARKRNVVDTINTLKPDLVIIANLYQLTKTVGSERSMSPGDWIDSMRRIVDTFRPSVGKVVFLAAPPGEIIIQDCYGKRGNVPADCIGKVTRQWNDIAIVEREYAAEIGGTWVDSRPWFCSLEQLCPAFAGSTATKRDQFHLAPAYGVKIYPVIAESFRAAGVPLS